MLEPRPRIQPLLIQEAPLEVLVLGIDLANLNRQPQPLGPLPPRNMHLDALLELCGASVEVDGRLLELPRRGVQLVERLFKRLGVGRHLAVSVLARLAVAGAQDGDSLVAHGGGVHGVGRGEGGVELGLDLLDVRVHGVGVVDGAERDEREVGELARDEAHELGHGAVVAEAGVAVVLHPVEAVVVTMIVVDGVALGLAEFDAKRGDAGKVLEGGEVAAAAHGLDSAVPRVVDGLAADGLVGGRDGTGGFVDDPVEEGRGRGFKVGSVGSDVDVLGGY